MKRILVILVILLITTITVNAQVLKGTVEEFGTNNKLVNVFIRDANNKQLALADKNGHFQLKTETGHTLIFDSPGYTSDTLYLIDMVPKTIKMTPLTVALREVRVKGTRTYFDPQKEYPEVYEKSKVYIMSPSSWFGKEGRDARHLKRYFAKEAQERHIDEVFTKAYVGSLVPLKDDKLENFMTLYRPTYAFIRDNNGGSLAVYVNDSYKKYMALPPDKRVVQPLVSQ